jgi:hypothetical protein
MIEHINYLLKRKRNNIAHCHTYLKYGGSQYRSKEKCIDAVVKFRSEWRKLFILKTIILVNHYKETPF